MELFITFLVRLFFLIGKVVVKLRKNRKMVEKLSISIALGTMTALVLFDLVPEVKEHMEGVSIWLIILFVIIGIAILKILDIFIPEHDDGDLREDEKDENLVHIGIVSLIAVALHNLIEGMATYSILTEDFRSGLLVAIGVGLHNIPMGMILTSTLQKENKGKRIIALIIATFSTFVGGLIMMLIKSYISDFVVGALISITLGMIIYIAFLELLPHVLHNKKDWKQSVIGIIIGFAICLLSTLIGG